ncbi:MAG: Pvc16 family protein [Kineosporiaceae bacterium]
MTVGAVFEDLHDVAQLLSEHIREETGIADVQPGAPREATATVEAGVRITLLYVTPQPGHRNDPLERQPDGSLAPPPLSLSCWYLVTTSGADAEDPVAAHSALGRVMTLYHDRTRLALPLSSSPAAPPGAFTDLGRGALDVIQVPMSLEQIDKIWTVTDVRVQPWVLLEAAPVQLVPGRPATPAPMPVRPGGIRLSTAVGLRPEIVAMSPQPVRPGGRLRLTFRASQDVTAVRIAGAEVLATAPGWAPVPGDTASAVVELAGGVVDGLAPGPHPVALVTGGLASRTERLRIADPDQAVVDAPPAAPHSRLTDLELSGAGLTGAEEVLAWPDAGVGAPSDVVSLPFAASSAGSVRVLSAGGLATLRPSVRRWRLTVRIATVFTPFVVLDLVA